MAVNYVKFQRGSQEAYDALKSAGKLDKDTLYFIYSTDNSSVGALYMGNRIISGGDITIASASLDDLADVVVAGAGTNSFLIKGTDGNWIAKSLKDVIALIKENLSDVPTQVFQATLEDGENDQDAITRVVGESLLAAGDIAVVKSLIADDKYQYTAYVYDVKTQAWVAMDGNYNATNIYFDNDLTITANIGVQEIDATGSKVLDTTGKNLKQVLDMILAKRKLPAKTMPSISVSSSECKSYEVGTTVNVNYTTTFNKGSYSYGPDTGIEPDTLSVTFNGETLNTNTGTFSAITVTDSTNERITAIANYSDGAIPVDNLGNVIEDTSELNSCQIKSGNTTGYSNYLTGYRNAFYGSSLTEFELNSANIRGLTANKSTNNSYKMAIVEGAKFVVIAVPTGRKVTKVADENAFGTDIFSEFIKSTVLVGGNDAAADNIGSNAKNYNVYVYKPATGLSANNYTVTLANE